MVSVPEQMPRLLEIAMRSAITRSSVSVLVIPGEIFLHDAVTDQPVTPIHIPQPVLRPNDNELRMAADLINSGKKITILAGAGCKDAHADLIATAAKLKAPIVHALRGKEFIEYDNPYDVGLTGLIGFSSGYHAMESCDTLLMLGTDFPYTQFFPSKARIAQVDVRGENLGRRCRLDVGVVADLREILPTLVKRVAEKHDDAH